MALADGNGNEMIMPVAPMYGGNGGFGANGLGGDWAWIILLLLLGWGNNGFGGNGGNGLYPWMNQADITTSGFQNAQLSNQLTGIQNSVSGISNQLCNSFSAVESGANARQMANMQGMFDIQSSLQNCCCENRAGIADLKYTVATENCADRAASYQNTRDIIDSQNRGTQAILDKLCQLELDGVKAQVEAKNDRIAELQAQLNAANLAASQNAQNALIQQGFANEVDQLYNRLNSCPVPTTPVYGRTPIFTCNGNNGCSGCGCGSF